MTTLRIPDLVGAAHKLRRGIYPEHEEALQAAEEWLAWLATSLFSYRPALNSNTYQE